VAKSFILPLMNRIIFFLIITICLAGNVNAQVTFPVNGPRNAQPGYYVFTNATLYIDYQTRVDRGTLIIRDGKIVYAGAATAIPQSATVIDLNGRYIYPAFIDLYTNYGVQIPNENKRSEQETRQFISAKKGAYYWNEAIRGEMSAADHFTPDDKKAAQLREAGFGAVLTGTHDGICRGSNALVYTSDGKEQELIITPQAAASFSFSKGSSRQSYPSSLMGSVALLRQTYYDAKWYKNQDKETNFTLGAFNKLQGLPSIFETENKLNILRADKIGDEFGVQYIIKGSGEEYQRMDEIKGTNAPLIIPVNFPKAYDIDDPFDADYVSTTDLKHWEMAPYNLNLLTKQKIRFAITSDNCESAQQFLQNIKKAVAVGLPEAEALKALTYTPATLINQTTKLGALKIGMLANFIITNAPVFAEEAVIQQTWVKGQQHEINHTKTTVLSGKYKIENMAMNGYELHVETDKRKTEVSLIGKDTLKTRIEESNGLFNLQVSLNKKGDSLIRLTAWVDIVDSSVYPYLIRKISGTALLPNAASTVFSAIWIDSVKADPKKKDTVETPAFVNTITFPFTDFGWKEMPKQETILFKHATVWTNEKDGILKDADVLIKRGKIASVGKNLNVTGAKEIDATGKHLTTGIIDEHSHIAISNGVNEGTQSSSSEVRIGDVVNSEDINIYRQLAGGVTASQLLHGSANPIGGQSALIKLRWGFAPDKMKIEGADGFIKFALGENVKQANWGDRAVYRYPQTRMGVEQVLYDEFIHAKGYEQQLKADPNTRRDLELDAIVEILGKKRFITCHSYVQSEINMLMHVADSMKFKVNTFTHILEGYKVADKMKAHGVNASTFADWWAYKMEVIEAIPYNAAILHKMGVNTAINSDDAEMGRRLNQEAAKIVKYGAVSEEDAWKMVTLNPAKMLHLDSRMGSMKPGKDADIVLWTDNPLSIYAKPEMTLVDGICFYSLEGDKQLRERERQERQRIIQKMIQAKRNGEKTEKKISKPEENYHCED
jgi:imidazolonepropionase-like amidohydrolase